MTEWDETFDSEGELDGGDVVTPRHSTTLRWAMLWYIAVNLAIGVPLLLIPVQFLNVIGVDDATAVELGGLRWMGAMLTAWAVAGIIIVLRPGGRAFFVTAGALQMSFGAAALLYSSVVEEQLASLWFHTLVTVVFVGTAVYLWVARFRAKEEFAIG
ncbi:MAG: hypothetical protein BMS9Abin07_0765 [Acidimicrobiia bacterium]|nr:MAG: hypothetical protein BMS9Abin07_0765 [Acidimicrobiia bacterium]